MKGLASLYDKMETRREASLRRARACSVVTIPGLFPPEGHNETNVLPTPYQSVGARGVSNLAAKLLLALFPPGDSFFRMTLEEEIKEELIQGDKKLYSELEAALAAYEKRVVAAMERSSMRPSLFELLKLLIVGGNALLHVPRDGLSIRVFRLDEYVCKRDPSGNLMDLIIRESVHPESLKPEIRELLTQDEDVQVAEPKGHVGKDRERVYLYTRVYLEDGEYKTYQEINEQKVPDSEGRYPVGKSPWFALRWAKIDGEDYGRGLCEELLGDLETLESLSYSMTIGAAASAKVLFFVRPGSTTNAKDCAKADSGDFLSGDANEVSTLQLEKFADFRVAYDLAQRIEDRLATAFLLREAVQRDAERVTAEEIRYMATELDDALGGIFSLLAQELQLPLVNRMILNLKAARKLPQLPEGAMEPVIVTGLDALGRSTELRKLDALGSFAFELGPELADKYIDIAELIQRRGTALGLDTKGLIRTDDEIQQREQQAQAAASNQQLLNNLPGLMKEGANIAAMATGDSNGGSQ